MRTVPGRHRWGRGETSAETRNDSKKTRPRGPNSSVVRLARCKIPKETGGTKSSSGKKSRPASSWEKGENSTTSPKKKERCSNRSSSLGTSTRPKKVKAMGQANDHPILSYRPPGQRRVGPCLNQRNGLKLREGTGLSKKGEVYVRP